MLRAKGIEDPETQQLLSEWNEREMADVASPEGQVEMDLKRGRLYLEGGLRVAAEDSFYAAWLNAYNARLEDLLESIDRETLEFRLDLAAAEARAHGA